MAAAGLLLLLDDIALVLDDVALLTKLATKKTAGVLGDDLALNAQQVAGVRADRELPVVWAVAKGSFRNKLILVPAAMAISALAPWAIVPLLMIGGAFLCYEGFEKLAHRKAVPPDQNSAEGGRMTKVAIDHRVDRVANERRKIQGAIRTDFILSAEIIIITLGTVKAAPFTTQLAVLASIAVIMTIGVYGLVAGIVKIDDAGVYLNQRGGDGTWSRIQRWLGLLLLRGAPWLMKALSIAGTAAMFLVGGGIITHGLHVLQPHVERLAAAAADISVIGPPLMLLTPLLADAAVGLAVGAILLALVSGGRRLLPATPR